jgi:dTDP-glucose 4,6-dehydratase
MNFLVTGGAGFIGSHFVRHILRRYPQCRVINLDKLTYAGNLENLEDVAGDPRYHFIKGDIADPEVVRAAMEGAECVVNFAAETHVDRSITSAASFVQTDVVGAYTLLEAARDAGVECFVQVSTDEVYGSLETGSATEESPLNPSNPYSASKAGGDLLALSYYRTHRFPVLITRSSNNYGSHQYPEKIIPLFVTNLLQGEKVPLYGDGLNVRDWLYVEDNCRAIDAIIRLGSPGEIYHVAGGQEMNNRELTLMLLDLMGFHEEWITMVADRPGHDRRYSLDASKLRALGWAPEMDFQEGLEKTVDWYRNNRSWWEKIKSGEYRRYYQQQYPDLKDE